MISPEQSRIPAGCQSRDLRHEGAQRRLTARVLELQVPAPTEPTSPIR